MRHTKIYSLLMALMCLTLFSHAQSGGDVVTVKHRRGETQVAKNPQRVVILDMGSLETYHELGIPVVGGPNNVPKYLEGFNERNPGYTGVGSVAGGNVAAIAELKPDLIIIGGRLGGVYDSLSTIAPTVLFGADNADTGLASRKMSVLSLPCMAKKRWPSRNLRHYAKNGIW